MEGQHAYPGPWLDALRTSNRETVRLVESLDADALRRPSYCDGWTVAQVLSHLGSGAEIFQMMLDAVLAGEDPPGREAFPPVWERWNAKSGERQAADFVAADSRLATSLRAAADDLAVARIPLFGTMTVDGAGFVGMRLNEHALHSWDVAVAFDPEALVGAHAVGLLVDRLAGAGFAGHADQAGDDRPSSTVLVTSGPDRAFRIDVDDAMRIEPVAPAAAGEGDLHLPAEAALRLMYGRLDDDHRPPVDRNELPPLDRLRRVFTGF